MCYYVFFFCVSFFSLFCCFFFFFNDTATTEIYTLSLHDALPITEYGQSATGLTHYTGPSLDFLQDRKSTRLNSSHANISYAVFCLKKKKTKKIKHHIKKKKKKKKLTNK